jgi:hypothetical protein
LLQNGAGPIERRLRPAQTRKQGAIGLLVLASKSLVWQACEDRIACPDAPAADLRAGTAEQGRTSFAGLRQNEQNSFDLPLGFSVRSAHLHASRKACQ